MIHGKNSNFQLVLAIAGHEEVIYYFHYELLFF